MTARRKATRRDLPAFCLIYCLLFAVAALGLPFAANLDSANKSDLQSITGSVENVYRTNRPKAGLKLHILLRVDNRIHHLTQDDLFQDVPELKSLRVGDNVTALVRHDFLGRDLDWLWELHRDGATILSYDETRRFLERENARTRKLAYWAGVLSIALFLVALLLRRHFGGWRDTPQQSVPAGF
jgi:hypothetical protein